MTYINKQRKKFITKYVPVQKIERWTICQHIATYLYYSLTNTVDLSYMLQGLKDDEQYPRDID